MNKSQLVVRVRSLTRDLSNSIFREQDIIDYLNEGVNRFRQVIPELREMRIFTDSSNEVTLLPDMYHELLALFSASRCFGQDERHYQASTFMNEFETKLEELKASIESGEIVIVSSETGEPVSIVNQTDYVKNTYFFNKNNFLDVDNGVEGV